MTACTANLLDQNLDFDRLEKGVTPAEAEVMGGGAESLGAHFGGEANDADDMA